MMKAVREDHVVAVLCEPIYAVSLGRYVNL